MVEDTVTPPLLGWDAHCKPDTKQLVTNLIRTLLSISDDRVYTEWKSRTRCIVAYSGRVIGRIDIRNGETVVLHFNNEMTDRMVRDNRDVRTVMSAFGMYYSCRVCRRYLDKVKRCSGCRLVTYCSQECQDAHWDARHESHGECCAVLRHHYPRVDPDTQRVCHAPMPVMNAPRIRVPTILSVEDYNKSKRGEKGKRGLMDLPREVLRLVVGYMDGCSRIMCRRVCDTLRAMIAREPVNVGELVRGALLGRQLSVLEYLVLNSHLSDVLATTISTREWCDLVREARSAVGRRVAANILGAIPNIRSFKVTEVVRVACRCGNVEVVRRLIGRIPREEKWRAMLSNEAVRSGEVECVEILHRSGFRVSRTASRIAGERGDVEMLEYLQRIGRLYQQAARRAVLKRRVLYEVYRGLRSRRGTMRTLTGWGFDCLLDDG